jgi:uncharacterized protein YkwD/uncharacterized membrane protein required for colicin V production
VPDLVRLARDFVAALPPTSSLSLLDYVLLITLGVFALDGLRRGLLLGVVELVGITLTLAAAVSLYPFVGPLIAESGVEIPAPIANVLAFAGLVGLGIGLTTLIASIVRSVFRPIMAALPPIRALDALGGVAPGLVKGAVVIALFAAGIRALPMAVELKRIFDGSSVIARTAPLGALVAPDLPPLLGRLGLDMAVVAPPPQAPSAPGRSLQLPPNVQPEVDAAAEVAMLELLNRERAAQGLVALTVDERLRQAARDHSDEMIRERYFAHESPAYGSPFDRMLRAGARFGAAGENLAFAPNVETAHRGLMNSPEHRKNILTPAFRRVGIGAMRAGAWGRMFTQNFAD